MSRFTDDLIVSPLPDGATWVIRSDFGYDVGAEGSGDTIDVPLGFMTDFASVPRVLWMFLPRWGKYGNAAVIHDFCYWDQRRPRAACDRIFLEAMRVLGVAPVVRCVLFTGVRLFGWIVWMLNRRQKRRAPGSRIHAPMAALALIAVPVAETRRKDEMRM